MASSTEPLLKLEQMADGENENTWGSKTNTNLALIANAIAKRLALTLGGSNVTLTDTSFADSQARSLALDLTGTISANIIVTIPSRSKMYIVRNGTSGAFSVVIGASGGTLATVPQSATSIIWCDGTDTVLISSNQSSGPVDAATLDGYDSSVFARLAANQSWTAGQATTPVQVTDAGTLSVDCALSNKFYTILGGNRTVALTNQKNGQEIEYWLIQDGTGGRTVSWPGDVVFPSGTPPLLSAANDINAFKLTYIAAITKWVAAAMPTQNLNSPVFTGNPTAPTATIGDSDTTLATTEFANPDQDPSDPGYVTLPGGMVIQWGSATAAANASTVVTYPKALATFSIAVVSAAHVDANAQDNAPGVTACTTTNFTMYNANDNALTTFWVAIGI